MPNGYLVNLGDGSLDPGDSLAASQTFFNTSSALGTGSVDFDYTWFLGSGTLTRTGTYYLGDDGFVYFIPDTAIPGLFTVTSADVATAPTYSTAIFGTSGDDALIAGTAGDNEIYGGPDTSATGTGNDTIDADAGDDTVFGGDGSDSIFGGTGNDVLNGQDGSDTILGGTGSDSIDGGAGDDSLEGGGQAPTTVDAEYLDWSVAAADEGSISAGFTQNTGSMDVTFTYVDDGNGDAALVESSSTQYVEGGEPFSTTSALELRGTGLGATSTATIEFDAATATRSDEVQTVSFRINDIDQSGWHDQLVVTAFDADGNAVPVTLTAAGNDTISGDTITAGPGAEDTFDADGSVLVQIAGPVHQIVVSYSNLNTATQAVYITDIHFAPIEIDGADTLVGGAGDDTITLGDLDVGQGGDGDDTFLIDSSALNGGTITVVGGEGDETDGDTLDLTGVLDPGSILYTNTDDGAGGLSGTATLIDGTILTFSEIETIICFTSGTMIETPHGERPIETLRPDDMILTLDNGPQPLRWIGRKSVSARGALAPIRFAKGSYGNHRDLLVSPQHRMLCRGYAAQLFFGEYEILAPAKSLVDDFQVTIDYGGMITYFHILFDRHEVVIANGAPSESFHPGGTGLDTLSDQSRDELFRIFPELRTNIGTYGPASRPCAKVSEARTLAMA